MDGDLSTMLRQVMENPQFGSMVETVKKQMGGADGNMDLSAMMEKLPALMGVLGPMMGNTSGTDGESASEGMAEAAETEAEPAKAEEKGEVAGLLGGGQLPFFKPGSRDKRNKLLAALKPYLSPARCSVVDRAMSAMQLGELLGTVMPGEKG